MGITNSTGCEEKTAGGIHKDKQSTKKGYHTNTHCPGMSINTSHGTNMALTSSSTRDNMSVGETCINGPKQHTVVDNYAPPTVVRNLMGEFHGVTITQTNGRQRMKSHQNDGEQKDSRQQLHNLECKKYKKPHTHRQPKKVYTMEIPNAQFGYKTATIAQTLKPALHQTYKICDWLKHIYMR